MRKICGNGSVQPRGKGKWTISVSLGYDPIKKKYVKKSRVVRGSKRQANAALEAFIQELETGVANAEEVTFGEYAEIWTTRREESGSVARSSLVRDRSCLKHLNAFLMDTPLHTIEPVNVEDLYNEMRDDGVGANTLRKCAIVLNQVMNRAVLDKIIAYNPCVGIKKPSQQDKGEARSLTKQEISVLMSALDNSMRETKSRTRTQSHMETVIQAKTMAVKLALNTGMRRGEILGLSWCDVEEHVSGRLVIKVRNSLDTDGTLKSTKTKAGRRDITLDGGFAQELAEWKRTQKSFLDERDVGQSGATPIVCDENGGYLDCNNFSAWWRAMLKANGMDGIRFHDLRHTHATMLLLMKVDMKTVSSRLGHASIAITMDTYAHVLREQDESAADAIGDLLNNLDA